MAIDSTSTLAEVRAEYEDNADYDTANSTAKARAFIKACRVLLIRIPAVSEHAKSARVEHEMALIQGEMDKAIKWLGVGASTNTQTVLHANFENFRD